MTTKIIEEYIWYMKHGFQDAAKIIKAQYFSFNPDNDIYDFTREVELALSKKI